MSLPDFDALWNFDDPVATRAQFQALLDQQGSGADPAWRLSLLTQIARTHSLAREFDRAHRLLDTVEAALQPEMTKVRVRTLLERGRTFNSSGQKASARPLFAEAFELARQAGEDGLAVDAAHMVAIAESSQEVMRWNLIGLDLARASEQPAARRWLGSLYNNIGWTYHDAGEYAKALEIFRDALELRLAEGRVGRIRIARWSVARALRSLGRVEQALEIQRGLLAEHQAEGSQDGFVWEELGECLLALGRPDEARPHFGRAHALLGQDEWLVENEPARLARLAELAGMAP